jgi:hypothetical protein
MTDLDQALAATSPEPVTSVTTATPRRCARHGWRPSADTIGLVTCTRCGTVKDETRSRRGKSARNRGNSFERDLAKRLGGRRTGMFGGPDDVTVNDLFVIQAKVGKRFPSWLHDELVKLPRTGGRIPLVVVGDAPGPGSRRRVMVVVGMDDWTALHGPTRDPERAP